MKNLWYKYKTSIVVGAYLLSVLVFGRFLLMPFVESINSRSDDVQAMAIDREMERRRISKLPELENELSDYKNQEQKMNVVLGENDQVGFIENVESMAQASGNKVELRIKEDKKELPINLIKGELLKKITYSDYFPIQISLEGDYVGLVNFIHLLENSQFYVNVLSVSSFKIVSENEKLENYSTTSIFSDMPVVKGEEVSDKSVENNFSIKTDIIAIVYTQKK